MADTSGSSVMLGYIHGGTVRAEFMASVLALIMHGNVSTIRGVTAGPLVAVARNLLASNFLESRQQWLWCVDTDMVFTASSLSRLLAAADPVQCPVISALYHVLANGEQIPAMYQVQTDADGGLVFTPCTAWPEGSLFPADAVGAGCLLIHRRVLEKIQDDAGGEPCWFREIVAGRKDISEDLSFSMRVTAAGFPLQVHTGVRAGHIKPVMIGSIT